MKIFYNLFIRIYPFIAQLIGARNTKAKLWVDGRRNIFSNLTQAFSTNKSLVIWMHCSSLGEFEQGRPVLEQLKSSYPQHKILLTFFSPSGYEIHKNYASANWIFYLPMDNEKNATQFFNIVQPQLILFVKYDFWYYYLQQAQQRKIPLLLISGVFRPNQPFFKWYGSFHKSMLHCFTHFFVQNEESKNLLHSIGIEKNVSVGGDTRFDRVLEIAEQEINIELIEKFAGNQPLIVAGSTWPEDDYELSHYINSNETLKCIIAPHDINNERIKQCQQIFLNTILWSDYSKNETTDNKAQCLIIDNVGMLSKLYKYATIAYVGGGFGNDGVHNVLEAAVFYKPVILGPEYEKYIEAIELLEAEGAWSIDSTIDLESKMNELLTNTELYKKACNSAGNYVQSKSGATKKVIEYIYENRLLTN